MDPQHDPHLAVARSRHHEELPRRPVQGQRHGHELPALSLKAGDAVNGVNEPDVLIEVK